MLLQILYIFFVEEILPMCFSKNLLDYVFIFHIEDVIPHTLFVIIFKSSFLIYHHIECFITCNVIKFYYPYFSTQGFLHRIVWMYCLAINWMYHVNHMFPILSFNIGLFIFCFCQIIFCNWRQWVRICGYFILYVQRKKLFYLLF